MRSSITCWRDGTPTGSPPGFASASDQVRAAVDYIREHNLEVITEYQKILARAARGNPPEVQARIDANRDRFLEFAARVRQVEEADPDARRQKIADLLQEYRRAGAQGGNRGGDQGGS